MRRTQIMLFGALEIVHGNGKPQRPPTQKVLSLLGYLIVQRGVPQSRGRLVDLFWPDLHARQGRRMLSDTLWRARRLLASPNQGDTSLLIADAETVTFRLDEATWLDVAEFEQLIGDSHDAPAFDDLHVAVNLYRGDFLEDCYDDWALIERERLRECYLELLDRLLVQAQKSNAHEQALQFALRLVHTDPLREDGYRSLMRCYCGLGREADALRAYEQCVNVLETDLGVTPDGATIALYEQIVQQRKPHAAERSVSAGTAVGPQDNSNSVQQRHASGTSSALVPFVGRRDEHAALLHAVEAAIAGSGGMVLLEGEAGTGKSRLLREVAVGADWRGAQVCWGAGREDAHTLPFEPLREALTAALTPERIQQCRRLLDQEWWEQLAVLVPEVAAVEAWDRGPRTEDRSLKKGSVGRRPSVGVAEDDRARQLYEAIAHVVLALGKLAPLVLVLEDLHWFDPATLEALAVLVPRLRGTRVLLLVSGRADELPQRTEIWQTLLRLDRSGLLTRTRLAGMNAASCAELVRHVLGMKEVARRFSTRLHSVTNGNPFFVLEMLRTLQEQGQLTRDANGIWHTAWDGPYSDYHELPLPASLQQTIGTRLQQLAAPERRALAAAAVLGQSFAPSVWQQMTRDGRPETEDRESAVEKYLPKTSTEPAPFLGPHASEAASSVPGPRSSVDAELLRRQFLVEDYDGYRFGHDTLREAVYAALDDEERRHLHLRAAEVLEHEHLARVESLAQHLYLAGAWEKALPYLIQAGDCARGMCAYRTALRCYDQASEAVAHLAAQVQAKDVDPLDVWTVQIKRGEVAALVGDYPSAIAAYEQALHLATRADEHGSRSQQIHALNGLCAVLGLTNDHKRARAAVERAIALADAGAALYDRAATHYHAGTLNYHADHYDEAQSHLQQALALYEAVDSQDGQARCLELLAWTERRHEGVTDRVVERLQRALAIYQVLEDMYRQRQCLVSLANVRLLRGDFEAVLQSCDAVLPFFRSTDARNTISECQYLRGVALCSLGRFTEALEANGEARAISQELGVLAAAEVNQIYIGWALCGLGRYEQGCQELEAACESQDRLVRPRALSTLAEVVLERGDLHRAFALAAESVQLVRNVGSQPFLGKVLRVLGQVRAADEHRVLPAPTPKLPDAETCFCQSIALLETACFYANLGQSWSHYGVFLLESGRTNEAQVALAQAQDLLHRTHQRNDLERLNALLTTRITDHSIRQEARDEAKPASRMSRRDVTVKRRTASRHFYQ